MKYASSYGTAKLVAEFVSVIGWMIVMISAVMVVAAFTHSKDVALISLAPGASGLLIGLVTVATGQITRASVDHADHSGEILWLLKQRLEPASPLPDAETKEEQRNQVRGRTCPSCGFSNQPTSDECFMCKSKL